MSENTGIRSRVCEVVTDEYHPETHELLLSEDKILDALSHRSIKRWAYVYHDKDVYTEEDEKENPEHKAGTHKNNHWHIVIESPNNNLYFSVVANWFGVPENFIEKKKGRGAFLDAVEYITHEHPKQQALGKHLYSDDEIKANFDFRDALTTHQERRAKYGRDLTDKEVLRNDVLFHGLTLREASDKYPLLYQEDFTYLEKCRLRYLSKFSPLPKVRMNYYIEGKGGVGKGLISRALARSLVDRTGTMNAEDIYYEVGANNVNFEGYDGQPVLIWNDCRAVTLLHKLGGRENVFNIFDPYPPDIQQNIKYGAIRLTNAINIVNSIQPWSEFLDGLAGTYKTKDGEEQKAEDASQSYRRFPFFLVLHEEDYDLGMNKGIFDGTREYEQYYMINGIRGNMRRIADACGDNMFLYNTITKQATALVTQNHDKMLDKMSHEQKGTDEEILEQFKDVGSPAPAVEPGPTIDIEGNSSYNPWG